MLSDVDFVEVHDDFADNLSMTTKTQEIEMEATHWFLLQPGDYLTTSHPGHGWMSTKTCTDGTRALTICRPDKSLAAVNRRLSSRISRPIAVFAVVLALAMQVACGDENRYTYLYRTEAPEIEACHEHNFNAFLEDTIITDQIDGLYFSCNEGCSIKHSDTLGNMLVPDTSSKTGRIYVYFDYPSQVALKLALKRNTIIHVLRVNGTTEPIAVQDGTPTHIFINDIAAGISIPVCHSELISIEVCRVINNIKQD